MKNKKGLKKITWLKKKMLFGTFPDEYGAKLQPSFSKISLAVNEFASVASAQIIRIDVDFFLLNEFHFNVNDLFNGGDKCKVS